MRAFSEAVRAIYDAALAPDAWPTALARIAEIFDARGAVVYFASSDGQTDFIASEGVEDAVRVYQTENWGPRDVHAQRILDLHLTSGDVVNDQLMVTDHEIETLPIYTDFFARVGFGWIMACVILPDLDMLVTVTVPRARDRGPYGADDLEMLRLIGSHVEQAMRISLRIANLEMAENALRAALDAMETAVFALDGQRGLVFANTAGEQLFSSLFATIAARVVPFQKADAQRFEALLASAACATETASGDVPPPHSCVLTRTDGDRTAIWALPVTAMNQQRIGARAPVRTLVFAAPVERANRIDPAVVRDAFRLSLGEARLATMIAGGLTVSAAAGKLGVTEGTARVVLKRIFRKLRVNRQAELVLQISTLGSGPRSGPTDVCGTSVDGPVPPDRDNGGDA